MPSGHVALRLPSPFGFKWHGTYDFQPVLSWFDWSIRDTGVVLDLSTCGSADYQALSLLVLYLWQLRAQGCYIELDASTPENGRGAGQMWRTMGAPGWDHVLWEPAQQFRGRADKPLLAIRDKRDFDQAVTQVSSYTHSFNIEYDKTLHYLISELLYNTMEHGRSEFSAHGRSLLLPSLMQFSWYRQRNELQFIIADLGIGVKRHLEQAYPAFASDADALRQAIRPQVSGTFSTKNGYAAGRDNAGVGLYLSTGIVQRLHADMFLLSGAGLLHVSPRDITATSLQASWPGTIAFLSVRLGEVGEALQLHQMMVELRERSRVEMDGAEAARMQQRLAVSMENYFGRFAENKQEVITFRERHLLPAIREGKDVLLDFNHVERSTHSFLSALLKEPVAELGMAAYKRIRVTNATPEIRETIDYIFDENTRA